MTTFAVSPPDTAATVPFATGRIGSWEFALRRRVQPDDALAAQYDRAAQGWEQTAARYGLVEAYRGVFDRSGIGAEGARVLDCGIGTGSLSAALCLNAPGAAVTGVDTSPQMLARAGQALSARGIRAALHQGRIEALPFPDAAFDVVMAAHVLEHLPDPLRGLSEMVRVLRPGGRLMFCVTRPSLFGALIQMRWRTWVVSEAQGLAWMQHLTLEQPGLCPIHLGPLSGQGSTAFWARKPAL